MSIQWTIVATYLYFEVAVVIVLISPLCSPRVWNRLLRSRLFAIFQERIAFYFYALLGVLGMFLIDSIREMKKYSHSTDSGSVNLASDMKGHIKLFRAQRNFYITGFAVFLTFVIKRLITMILIQYELEVKAQEIIKKAEDTVKEAKSTILANTLQENEEKSDEIKSHLESTKSLLEAQNLRVKELEEEASKWRLKYEEICSSGGKGDE